MIKVLLGNINDFELPLDNFHKITRKGNSKRVLKRLEKKYGLKSHFVCRKMFGTYELYANSANFYVPEEIKEKWIENYKIYVAS